MPVPVPVHRSLVRSTLRLHPTTPPRGTASTTFYGFFYGFELELNGQSWLENSPGLILFSSFFGLWVDSFFNFFIRGWGDGLRHLPQVSVAQDSALFLGNPGQYVHQGRCRGHPGYIMAPWQSRQKVDFFP